MPVLLAVVGTPGEPHAGGEHQAETHGPGQRCDRGHVERVLARVAESQHDRLRAEPDPSSPAAETDDLEPLLRLDEYEGDDETGDEADRKCRGEHGDSVQSGEVEVLLDDVSSIFIIPLIPIKVNILTLIYSYLSSLLSNRQTYGIIDLKFYTP